MRQQEPPGFWKKYARVIELASIALILLGLFTNFAINQHSISEMLDILILAGIAMAYMLAYFHLALPTFGDKSWMQVTNVFVTVFILVSFQYIAHLTPQTALMLMLVVCITGLRLGLAASLLTGIFSALLSLAAVAYNNALAPADWFFFGFQLIVYILAAYLSTQLARTLSNQTEETIQRNRNLGLLLEMSAIGNSLELDVTLPEMAAKIVNGLSASFCSIHLLEQDDRILVTSAAYSSRKEDDISTIIGRSRLTSKVPWHRKAIETQQVMIFRQDKPYMRIRAEENLEMLLPGIQSACLIPLVFGEQVLGVISVGERRGWERERFDDLKLDLLVSIGAQAAVVVNNARLHQSIRKQVKRMEVLHEVTRALTSTIEMNSLMEIMYQQLNRVIPAETYFLGLHEEGDDLIDLHVIIDEGERFPSYGVPYGPGFTSHVIRTRKPLLIRHLSMEKDDLPVRGVLLGSEKLSETWLGVPILVNEAVTGVLVIASYKPNAFQEDDVALLTSMAGQAALALNNARRHAEVEEQSRRDSLTGVYNHSYFVQRLNQEVEHANDSGSPLSLIMLDIDFFKKYNDTYGHVTGDQVLRIMVQAIQAHIQSTDAVGRWGGEEFAIVLPGCNLENACKVASGIRQTLSDLPIVVNEHSVPAPTISQGIAAFPQHAPNASQLVDVADRALYEAKKQGRDQIHPATICRVMTG